MLRLASCQKLQTCMRGMQTGRHHTHGATDSLLCVTQSCSNIGNVLPHSCTPDEGLWQTGDRGSNWAVLFCLPLGHYAVIALSIPQCEPHAQLGRCCLASQTACAVVLSLVVDGGLWGLLCPTLHMQGNACNVATAQHQRHIEQLFFMVSDG